MCLPGGHSTGGHLGFVSEANCPCVQATRLSGLIEAPTACQGSGQDFAVSLDVYLILFVEV